MHQIGKNKSLKNNKIKRRPNKPQQFQSISPPYSYTQTFILKRRYFQNTYTTCQPALQVTHTAGSHTRFHCGSLAFYLTLIMYHEMTLIEGKKRAVGKLSAKIEKRGESEVNKNTSLMQIYIMKGTSERLTVPKHHAKKITSY